MDEPLSNLDAKLRLHTRGELKRFQRELATTTIYVTHDQAEAMTLADRVAIMNRGILQQVGPPKAVYANPVNVFVAGFLGSPPMNLLRFELIAGDGGPVLAGPSLRQPLPPLLAQRLDAGSTATARSEVILGVRPEDLRLSRQSINGSLPAEVFVVEDLGNERLVTVRLDGQLAVAREADDFPAEMGETIWLSFDPARAHLFDPTTERRLG